MSLTIFLKPIIIIACLIGLYACAPIYYSPSAQNVPLHRNKEEVRASGSIGTGSTASSIDFQGSYAFHDRFAVMMNFQSARWETDDFAVTQDGDLRAVEAGLGYYHTITDAVVFETYAGGGGGTVTSEYQNGRSRLGFGKFFIQPQIGYVRSAFEFAFGTRFLLLDYRNAQVIGDIPIEEERRFFGITDRRSYLLVEPSITLRFGNDPVKMQIQVVPVSNLTDATFRQDEFLLSAGLQVKF